MTTADHSAASDDVRVKARASIVRFITDQAGLPMPAPGMLLMADELLDHLHGDDLAVVPVDPQPHQ